MHPIKHFKTITEHKRLVGEYCFRLGLYRQGLMHDLSKYSPVEFIQGARYYQGYRSPNPAERDATGRSLAWLHHKGRNKHHLEYWVDYFEDKDGEVRYIGGVMPKRYVAEMFCDRLAASKIYLGDKYDDSAPYEHFLKTRTDAIHPDTDRDLEKMLLVLKDEGEDAAFAYVKEWLRPGRKRRGTK